MKKMWKRFVSLLLACTLLAGMLPLSASAAVSAPTEDSQWITEKIKEINAGLEQGEQYHRGNYYKLGDSDLYRLTFTRTIDTETATITDAVIFIVPGTDADENNSSIPDYNSLGETPWEESSASAIYIADGVTGIGDHAFDGMSTLETIEFENSKSLTKVGEYAFNNCDKMVGLSLDLSNVTTLGKYAFNGCERLGSGENNKGVTLSDALTTIPENAFNTCGLKNVNIPKSCTKIEKNAFAHNSLSEVGELVLPDGLVTIGDSAFVVTMGSGDTSVGITSLTIPSSVESIGANAFSGRRNLAEVTVEDDDVPNTELELGNAAFGFNESSAFSEWGSITDDRTGQKYEGTMGTKFYLPADLTEKFINGTNCYTGDIEPMKWVKTQQPTCDTDGYHLYETTKKGAYDDEGKLLVLQYKYTIPMLGHDYQLKKSFSATCETNSYELWVCTRDETHTENRKIGEVSKPKGHNYQLTQVDDTEMGGGNDTTFTWVCQTKEHDDTRDSLDKTLEITIEPATIQANTSMTVGDLADMMPQVDGGKLSLAEDEKLDAALTTDTKSVRVVFTPDEVKYADYTNVGAVSEFNNADLTLEVNVSKAKLDFSSVRFGNCLVGINPGEEVNVPITIERGNLPEDVKAGAPVYTEHGNKEGSTTPPSIGKSWTGTVSVTFTYDPKKYEEETKNLPAEYTYSQDPEAGTVKITHSYVVTKLEMTNVSATAIPDLEYTGSPMETVHVYGIPAGSTVFWEWVSTTDSSVTSMGSAENGNSPNLQIAEITNAGTYEVTITITNKSYETYTLPSPVTVTIQKAKIETPKPQKDLVYTSHKLIGLASPDANAKYSYQEGSKLVGVNAGTYTAMAVLTDTANYEWTESDDDGDGAVTISWNIAKRRVIETSINSVYKDQTTPFTGTPITAVSPPSSTSSGFFDVEYDDEGNLVGKIKGTETVAFKISHAQETNAETYTVIASIEDFANFCWQNHPDDEDVTLGTWTIGKLQINAPTITAEGATYTGGAYAGKVTLVHSDSSEGIIDLEKTKSNILYYTQQTGGNGGDAPVNAGTYFAGVESNGWAFVDGKLATNYQILGGARDPFSITKATAKMTFTEGEVTEIYTADGTTLQQVTVDGLVDADKDEMKTVLGDVKYTYKYSTEPNTNWDTVEEVKDATTKTKFTDVGYYQITAKWGAGTVSNNYTAKDASYTLTITQANDQKITLTNAGTNKGQWDGENNSYTTTYGSEKTFTVTGTAELDKPVISYAVKKDSEKGPDGNTADVVSVDSTGEVTIKQAGEATITVKAADTANVAGTSVDYTVTVEKATPTVNTNLTDNKLEVPYTGKPITGYDIAEPTANVVEEAAPPTGAITYTFYTDEGCDDADKVTTGGGTDKNVPIAVGTYYMKASYPGDTNYTSAESEPVTVTVTKAQLTVDAEGYEGTYDGKTYPAITIKSVKGNGTTLAQGQYTVKYAKTNTNIAPGADADVWQNLLTVKDVADSSSDKLYYWYMVTADNYNPAIGKVEVKITPAPLTVTGEPASYEKEYDGDKTVDETFDEITVTAKDVPEVTIDVDATGTYDNENADKDKTVTLTLTLTLSGTDGANIDWGNYSYNDQALTDGQITLTKAGAGTITPKAITVTGISAENRVYDGTTDVELKGEPKTEDTLFNEDKTVSLALAEGAKGQLQDATAGNGKAVSVGNDAVEITGEGSGNYSVTVSLPNLTVDIKKATPTVTITGASNNKLTVAYTGNPVNIAATVAGISDTDKPTGEVTFRSYESAGAAQNDTTGTGGTELKEMPSNGGPYYLRAFIAEDTNYKAAVSDYVELVIDATALSVTTGKPAEKPYTGKEHNMAQWADMKVQFSGKDVQYDVVFLKKGEDETSAPDAEDEKWNSGVSAITNVAESGEYWYKVTAKEGEGNFNPHVSTSAITFTVTPATLTLSSSLTKEKGYDGTTVAVVTGQKVTGAQNGENITVPSVSAAYDNANVGTGKTITITYTLSTEANLGNYKYNDKALAADTQTVSETVSDCSITQAPVTVTISDQTSVYDGKTVTPIQTEWKVSDTDLFDVDNDGIKDDLGITLTVVNAKNAGKYAITGTANNSNYAVTFAGSWAGEGENKDHAGTYTIEPRPINVQIGNAEGFYGDAPDLTLGTKVILTPETAQGEEAGLVNGENIYGALEGLSLGSNATVSSSVGENYTIYPLNDKEPVLDDNGTFGNYNVTFTNEGTYTVNPRPITITIADHSSVYGDEIDDGIASPASGTDYQVSLTKPDYTGSGTSAIVNDDALTVTLTTAASNTAAAGPYDIIGSVTGDKVKNYDITWAGNGGDRGDEQGNNGKYTIKEAELAISFEKGNQVSNGVSINITDSYKDNPLVLENASTSVAVSDEDKESLTITYSIAAAGENSGSTDVATINETTGEVTILKTGTVRITATVTPQDNSNYTGTQTTWYELNIISGGQMTLMVTPKTNLAYTGEPQELIETPICSLDSAKIQYSLDNQKWEETIPTGIDAGSYTVYVKATDPNSQYSDVTEHVMVTIDKATLEGSFAQKEYTHVLTTGNSYDSATVNPLDLSANPNYSGQEDAYIYRSDNMDVAIAVNGESTIRVLGSAGDTADITVTVPEDNNYNGKTFTYTLEISNTLSDIQYDVTGTEATYNGQPQTIAVKVTAPASGATVRYWNEETKEYDLSEPPAYTDVQEGGYPIKFQITAPGYKTEEGTATLTINPKDISQCQVEGIAASYTFVNKPIEPQTVEVVDGSVILKEDTDYTITYGANTEVGEDKGSVIIKGTGNYTGSVTKNFEITPVDASDLTASLNRTFGYYGDSYTNNATVTVTHGSHTVTSDGSNTVSIAVKDNTGTDVTNQSDVVSINDHQTVTFNQVGTYTIEVTVTGNHATNAPIKLTYALLPVEEGTLVLEADNETSVVETYGDTVNGAITVTDANGTSMTENIDYSLTYTYTPFEGAAQDSKPYDSNVMSGTPAAGMYVVTATGQGGYVNSVGTFTFLILQRDLAEADLTVEDSGLVYNQNAQTPSFTVAVTGNPTADDYEVAYYNNVNASDDGAKAVVTATGNNFTGSQTAEFTIAPKEITDEMVQDIPEQYYTGNAVIPPVTITDGNYTLILGYDYTTACEDKGPGAATVTITGTGNYTETTTKDFVIKSEGAPEPSERFDLAVRPSQWTWGDDLKDLALNVTFGTGNELTLGREYTLSINNEVYGDAAGETKEQAIEAIKSLKPGEYTITATGVGAYNGSTDTETVTIQKIQPEVTVTATPNSLSGGGKVTLTLKGEKLPAFAEGEDLSDLLTVKVQNGQQAPNLTELEWTENQDGSLTAELTLPNTNETYTFALRFAGDEYYEPASSDAMVVVGQQTSGGGGGSDPGDQPADPDDTGVSDWLNTKDHLAYLAGYPGGTFGPDQNMTRAEAAQMFYNLLLEKDVEITVEFEDVPADAWYAKPVNTLASLGILSGVGNGRFDPERSITRAEFTVIAMKFANTSGGGVNIFSDVNEDDWFYSAVVDSTQYGWINGYPDGTFRPEATISRAEVTVIVNHMLGRAADRPYVIAHEEELNTFGDVNRGHWGYFHVAEATNAHEYHTEDGTESWTGLS